VRDCGSSIAYLHKVDWVAGERGPFADAPCFRPIVPRMTSCRGEESQPIEYLSLESQAPLETKEFQMTYI
jgi:hypothetical protein